MDLNEIRARAITMAAGVAQILELIEKGFMENKAEYLTDALKKEHEINESERELATEILSIAKGVKDKKALAKLAQMIEMLERMGDEAASLIERIEMKVAEKLLFSEEGVKQFMETYHATRRSVEMMGKVVRGQDHSLKQNVIDNGFHVKDLVERYRALHADRLAQGMSTPLGANMYFDMLDFTGNLARHSSNIVKLF